MSLDIELLQARWVLGNTSVDELVKAAVSLLEDGFDGTALQQLAGLSQPTLRDVGDLPSRAFAEMGLKSMNPNEAVALLIARACNNPVVSALYEAFPNFGNFWKSKKSVVYSSGPYSDMGEFARFVIEDAYEKGNLDETRRAFQFLEKLLVEADQDTRDLVGYGFFETLRNVASRRPGGDRPYEQFLGPHI